MKSVRTFLKLPFLEKVMVFEVLFYTAKYRWLLLHRPFNSFADKLGEQESSILEYPDKSINTIVSIRKIVYLVSRHTPWKSECLVQAFSAKRMLFHRRIPVTVYMGVLKDSNGEMKAHAWSKCGDVFVTGWRGHEDFTVTKAFYS